MSDLLHQTFNAFKAGDNLNMALVRVSTFGSKDDERTEKQAR